MRKVVLSVIGVALLLIGAIGMYSFGDHGKRRALNHSDREFVTLKKLFSKLQSDHFVIKPVNVKTQDISFYDC